MIRLFVIEDHPVIINGLRNMFRPDREGIEVAGSANSVSEALVQAPLIAFDIFLLDLWISGADPVRNLGELKSRFPLKPILVYTSEESSAWRQKMLRCGAHGYLVKSASKALLRTTIGRLGGGYRMPAESGEEWLPSGEVEHQVVKLSPGEREILLHMAEGKPAAEVAKTLRISVSTLEKRMHGIRERCNAPNNIALIRFLTQNNLL